MVTQENNVLQLKMGGSGSKSKGFWPFSGSVGADDPIQDGNEQSMARARSFTGATPFVLTRRRDNCDKKWTKKSQAEKDSQNLTSQGIIKLEIPCIHVDFPVVLCEA
ncbi:hypothetical protein F7725_017016 [Dissostichus mawsoni]|uniref:Uncharacterized protein n=1 Tax=Dissostichus mawsoni TaxID=36200 RepID=A0A7J5Z459_DISMA|nr:hypothetical protein F7725_017016 [Dissostichus mawsoni]